MRQEDAKTAKSRLTKASRQFTLMRMRTLYADWQLRRERLAGREQGPYFSDQARVLDYLLGRYSDDPLAREPARFPLQTELFLNSRAIIVHHHLGRGAFNGTRTPAEAHSRARKILRHIAEVNPQDSIGAPGSGIDFLEHGKQPLFSFGRDLGGLFEAAVLGKDAVEILVGRCRRLLAQDSTLPEWAVTHLMRAALTSDIEHPEAASAYPEAVYTLKACDNDSAIQFFVDEWIADRRPERFLRHAFEHLTKFRMRALDRVRARLGDGYWAARARAAILLGQIGTLDDIGLLQDLLALPEVQSAKYEHAGYLASMRQLSGMTTERIEDIVK